MSTLKADTIQSTGGGAATLTKQTAAKVFLNFDQDAPAVEGSLNITSVTDTGTGIFDPQFTNNFADVHYACAGMGCDTFIITLDDGHEETVLTTTSDCQMKAQQGGGGLTDNEQTMVIIHGDLA
jgi:hypothetical protein